MHIMSLLLAVYVIQTFCETVLSSCLFDRHKGYLHKHSRTLTASVVSSVPICEYKCLEYGSACEGANLVPMHNGKYSCELIQHVGTVLDLRPSSKGIFTIKSDPTNDCESQPCQNGARCLDFGSRYQCICPLGVVGQNCETDAIDSCLSGPCLNDGTCLDYIVGYTCSCGPYYTGPQCEIDPINECDAQPCNNGGSCIDMGLLYQCICPDGVGGRQCTSDIYDSCTPSPCQNGGICSDQMSGFTCACETYFTGSQCETPITEVGIGSCMSSSNENAVTVCENSYDGDIQPGHSGEWAASWSDQLPTLTLTFTSMKTLTYIDIWWRCNGRDQYITTTFIFSDGSTQSVPHSCEADTGWLRCAADPEERFVLSEVSSDGIIIEGTVDCVPGSGNNGFREIRIWGY